MKFLIVILLVISPLGFADDYIYLGAWSKHSETENWDGENYNESHYLIGYQKSRYMAGYYKNSFNESTFVITKSFEKEVNNVSFFVAVGATHGYTDCENKKRHETKPKVCGYYQAGITYTKHRIQPVIGFSGQTAVLSFRIKI